VLSRPLNLYSLQVCELVILTVHVCASDGQPSNKDVVPIEAAAGTALKAELVFKRSESKFERLVLCLLCLVSHSLTSFDQFCIVCFDIVCFSSLLTSQCRSVASVFSSVCF